MDKKEFVHLHVHTEYSLLDGAAAIKELVETAKNMGQTALAITDHGVMYGAVDFYKAAKAAGIKPIIGCEVYVASRSRFDKQKEFDSTMYHLILLAKNENGYKNLIKLVSAGFTQGYYYKPRVDHEILKQYSKDLVCLSACLAGEVSSAMVDNDYATAKKTALWYKEVFGSENYFIEIQDHNIDEQKRINPMLIKLANEIGVGLVATNDLHYIKKQDAKYQDVLMCIQMGKTVNDTNRMKFSTEEFYLKSADEMYEIFGYVPSALGNTLKIADMCNMDFDFTKTYLPKFDVPDGENSFEYLKKLCYDGLYKRYSPVSETHIKRLEYELSVINSMGYVDYFLIVWDFIKYAKDNLIPVGPGRGSGAGSIVAYCLDITTIDPLKYNLLFERFLNPERVSMPDIDTDFCIERRGEVIDYVIRKYGADRVAQIVTFGTLKARAAIRDVGRALDVPLPIVDKCAKLVPTDLKMTIKKALEISGELRQMYETDGQIHELIDTASAVEGLPRHSGVHAAGVVIAEKSVDSYVPLQVSKGVVTTQYHMDNLGELGLLKMDFLGLRNLTVIKYALDNIQKTQNIKIDLQKLTYDDKEVYDLISSGATTGIFQLESEGMREFMKELKPNSLEDIIAGISLYRPGPMDQIPRYIKNKNNPDKITYKHPSLESILNVTYGCIIYQEQVLQIVQKLAGYSLGKADLLRRAMSKKKHDVMQKERQYFIYGQKDENGNVIIPGAIANGIDESIAKSIFDEIMDFASYAFNKSHAAAYAVVAYQTGYLKAFYPKEYMAALISSTMDNTDKTVGYIAECADLGIKTLPPDINKSLYCFSVENNSLRFGLEAIKNIGHSFPVEIEKERKSGGEFKNLLDFFERMLGKDLNKRAAENLIKCGAFDCFGAKRSQLLAVYENVLAAVIDERKNSIEGQFSLFEDTENENASELDLPDIKELPKKDLLAFEKDTAGMYLSGHPLDDYKEQLKKISTTTLQRINALVETNENGEFIIKQNAPLKDGDRVIIGGIITARKNMTTKSNTQMAFLTFEDLYSSIEVIVFPKVYIKYSGIVLPDSIIVLKGRLSIRDDESPKIILESAYPFDAPDEAHEISMAENGIKKPQIVYIKLTAQNEDKWDKIKEVIKNHRGETPVRVYFERTSRVVEVSKELFCTKDEKVISEISNIIGKDNVKIR